MDIPDAKALRFFRTCDKDKSGEIDFEEFRTVLYATDPGKPGHAKHRRRATPRSWGVGMWGLGAAHHILLITLPFAPHADSGNPTGFTPSNLVGPRDVFDMFDEDNSGEMDEDELFYAIQARDSGSRSAPHSPPHTS
jgi:hypothetical protein